MKAAVFYGDSNTYGVDPSKGHKGERFPEEDRWIGILRKELSPEWSIVENSTVGRCIPAMEFELRELDECLEACGSVDLFGVMLGINDYLSRSRPDPERVGRRMSAMLTYVREHAAPAPSGEPPRLLVIAPPPVDFTGDRFYEKFSTTDGRLAAALRAAALEAGADFLDTADWALPMFAGDHIHLTKEGHHLFADHILAYFDGWTGPARS